MSSENKTIRNILCSESGTQHSKNALCQLTKGVLLVRLFITDFAKIKRYLMQSVYIHFITLHQCYQAKKDNPHVRQTSSRESAFHNN